MKQETAKEIVEHIFDSLESYFEEGTFFTGNISDDFRNELCDYILKIAAEEK